MTKHSSSTARSRTSLLLILALLMAALLICTETPTSALAGTYPMYQCSPGTEAVSPGWSVFGVDTYASTVLSNTCSASGSIGDYVASNEQAGAVTENGHSGSQVGLKVAVPASSPDVTIRSITGEVIGSSVTGDDVHASPKWTSVARRDRAFQRRQRLHSQRELVATARFSRLRGVCQLFNRRQLLQHAISRGLDRCTGTDGYHSYSRGQYGTRTHEHVWFAVHRSSTRLDSDRYTNVRLLCSDADSGVRSATLTLTPQGGQAPYTHMFDFSGECTYVSWNACPLKQGTNGFSINTASLKDDSYTASASVTDAAGNTVSDQFGTLITHNAPAGTSVPTILIPGEVLVGSEISTHPGSWTAPSGAGSIAYAYQWEQCDTQGNDCQSIASAQNASYTPSPADIGHTLRVIVSASDSDGTTPSVSAATSTVLSEQGTLGALPGPGTGKNSTSTPALPIPIPVMVGVGTANGTPASESATITPRCPPHDFAVLCTSRPDGPRSPTGQSRQPDRRK